MVELIYLRRFTSLIILNAAKATFYYSKHILFFYLIEFITILNMSFDIL